MRITKRVRSFAAAHSLPNHRGGCSNLHGHNYGVELIIEGPLHPTDYSPKIPSEGMVLDFQIVSELYNEHIHDIVDHAFLVTDIPSASPEWFQILFNYCDQDIDKLEKLLGKVAILPISGTTAEQLAQWIFRKLSGVIVEWQKIHLRGIPPAARLVEVRVYETETAYASAT